MSMNDTSFDSDQFLAVHSAIHVLLFIIFVSPVLVLCVLCIFGLLPAKDINWKMKVILINILVPEIIVSLSGMFYLLGYPIRVHVIDKDDEGSTSVSCPLFLTLYNIAFLGNAFEGPFFVVAVFLFTKYGIKKLKWIGIVTYIAVSWVINTMCGVTISLLLGRKVTYRNGFCVIQQDLSGIIVFFTGVTIVVLNLIMVMVFSVCNFLFIKSNQITTENSEAPSNPLKKAILKVLAFYAVREFCILIQLGINTTIFRDQRFDNMSSISRFIIYYAVVVFNSLAAILTPISSAVFLKPVRDSLKQMSKKLRSFCRGNE